MLAATGFAKITRNEPKTPPGPSTPPPRAPEGGVPKSLMQVKRLGSWGRVCPKLTNFGDWMQILGRNLQKLPVLKRGKNWTEPQAPNSARGPLVPLHLHPCSGYKSTY